MNFASTVILILMNTFICVQLRNINLEPASTLEEMTNPKDHELSLENMTRLRAIFTSQNFMFEFRSSQLTASRGVTFDSSGHPFVDQTGLDFSWGTRKLDKIWSQCQSQKAGGPSAVVGDDCNFTQWENLRKPVLDNLAHGTQKSFNEAVHNQTAVYFALMHRNDSNFFNFFRDHCIQCTNHPLLVCNKQDQKCACHDDYVKTNERPESGLQCQIKPGRSCEDHQGPKCVENAFCNEQFKCECRWNKVCLGKANRILNYSLILCSIMIGVFAIRLIYYN